MWEYKIPEKDYYDDYRIYEILYDENPVRVFVDDEFTSGWGPLGRRPYYQMRGKRITSEQALDIISKTDNFFGFLHCQHEHSNCGEINNIRDIYLGSINFDSWWFNSNHSPEKYGWVRPNGIIGTNAITQKWPDISEFAEEWLLLVHEFPYLDLMIAITWWDELSHERWQQKYDERQKLIYEPYDNFCQNLEVGIWVHDRKIEIVGADRAAELYKEYERLYEEEDKRIYVPEYYSDFEPDVVTRDYLKRCLKETYGIEDPDKFLEEHTRPYQMENLK